MLRWWFVVWMFVEMCCWFDVVLDMLVLLGCVLLWIEGGEIEDEWICMLRFGGLRRLKCVDWWFCDCDRLVDFGFSLFFEFVLVWWCDFEIGWNCGIVLKKCLDVWCWIFFCFEGCLFRVGFSWFFEVLFLDLFVEFIFVGVLFDLFFF